MAFEKLKFKKVSNKHMLENSYAFYDSIIRRRTVRDFSDEEVPIGIIYNAIKSASSAPSGANKQPWHFAIVKDLGINCLLYTSPSPRDKRQSRMPSSA